MLPRHDNAILGKGGGVPAAVHRPPLPFRLDLVERDCALRDKP